MKWFKKSKKKEEPVEIHVARLPGGVTRDVLEPASSTWNYLVHRLGEEIVSLQEQLTVPGNTRTRDLLIKGQIQSLKMVLDLPNNIGRESAQDILTRQYAEEMSNE